MAHILIIDDDAPTRQLLRDFLEGQGHHIVEAENGKVGIEIHRSDPAEVIITDIFMPEKNGLRVIRELQREDPAIKIIAISGGGDLGNLNPLILAEEVGIEHTLTKPFHMQDLLDAIQDLLLET
ncbi:MAG: response regulator [bacterium]|nr:response regulator [bacterium]